MKLVRFMSSPEWEKYQKGETIRSEKDFSQLHMRSTSKGVCFFDDSEDPEWRMKYIVGAISDIDHVIVVAPSVAVKLTESFGWYRDPLEKLPDTGNIFDVLLQPLTMVKKKEWCVPAYSRSLMPLVRHGRPYLTPEGWKIE